MRLRKRAAFKLDAWCYGYLIQPLACRVFGHEPIPAASWYVAAEGNRCAYCGKDTDQ